MFKKLVTIFRPVTISKALEICVKNAPPNKRQGGHWYEYPVQTLIDELGDIPIADVTPEMMKTWYYRVKGRPNLKPNKDTKLSPWTVDHYGRAIRAFFNRMVEMGHLEKSPFKIPLPRLPKKSKKEIAEVDIDRMVQWSERNPRDHAMVLVLRDSGCRVGELISMRVSFLEFKQHETASGKRWEGQAYVEGKMNANRWICFQHDACVALRRYLRIRPVNSGEFIWLNKSGDLLTRSGVYQALKRIAAAAGVKRFNPHAFRHSLAKYLLKNGAPEKVIQGLMGHRDYKTTMDMYIVLDDAELQEYARTYTIKRGISHDEQSP